MMESLLKTRGALNMQAWQVMIQKARSMPGWVLRCSVQRYLCKTEAGKSVVYLGK